MMLRFDNLMRNFYVHSLFNIDNVQDANSKDDSDMDDIEIELEIHVSPKKLATADKPTAHSNHGGDKSQIAHSSKSSIRYL